MWILGERKRAKQDHSNEDEAKKRMTIKSLKFKDDWKILRFDDKEFVFVKFKCNCKRRKPEDKLLFVVVCSFIQKSAIKKILSLNWCMLFRISQEKSHINLVLYTTGVKCNHPLRIHTIEFAYVYSVEHQSVVDFFLGRPRTILALVFSRLLIVISKQKKTTQLNLK